jgi:transmembrane sensor
MTDSEIEREIVMAVLTGEASELERRLLRARREADPELDEKVARMEWVWAASRDTGILQQSSPPSPEAIIAGGQVRRLARRAGRPRTFVWGSVAAAASVLVALWLGVWVPERSADGDYAPRTVVTGVDEIVTVALEDGTMVRLAPDSRLEFGGGPDRTVHLTGRAFFAVAHQSGNPFRVRLPNRTITVLGTRFDVEGRDDRTRVAVVEGEVQISGAGAPLTARQAQVAYGPSSGALVIQRVEDIYDSMDWLGSFLAFETTPLLEVAQEIRDRFGLNIAISDTGLSARTLTGWFTDQTPEGMIAAICTAVGARCSIDGRDVRMDLPESPGAVGA